MIPLTELEIDGAVYNLSGSALTSGGISRKFAKPHWSLRDCQALFLAAWKAGGRPEATQHDVDQVVTTQTLVGVRAGLVEAAQCAIDERLRGRRYLM